MGREIPITRHLCQKRRRSLRTTRESSARSRHARSESQSQTPRRGYRNREFARQRAGLRLYGTRFQRYTPSGRCHRCRYTCRTCQSTIQRTRNPRSRSAASPCCYSTRLQWSTTSRRPIQRNGNRTGSSRHCKQTHAAPT